MSRVLYEKEGHKVILYTGFVDFQTLQSAESGVCGGVASGPRHHFFHGEMVTLYACQSRYLRIMATLPAASGSVGAGTGL